MTEREICERIVKDRNCGAIVCSGSRGINKGTPCPFDGECDYDPLDMAKQWLLDHPEGCEYCKEDGKQIIDKFGMSVYVYKQALVGSYCDDDGHIIEAYTPINFCPMCGRKMEGV